MMRAVKIKRFVSLLLVGAACVFAADEPKPLRVAIVGLVHGHAGGFLSGGALAPAGGAMKRDDVKVVGIIEPDDELFAKYAKRYRWSNELRFRSVKELSARAHPDAALVFTSTAGHRKVVEECAGAGIHVMMEKPLAVSYQDALAMEAAAKRGKIHVLVDYETTWYASNKAAGDLLAKGDLGPIVKAVVRDGHNGPQKIHVTQEFFTWLTDPKLNGAGALYDFGCYGADLMTWMMKGEAPESVTAVTRHLQPSVYPKVEDEADVMLAYKNAIAIVQGSWNWPFNIKDMDVYGQTGHVKTIAAKQIALRREGDKEATVSEAAPLKAPYDDPLHLLAAVIRGEVQEGDDLSSMKTNVTVSAILDAARRSAATGQTIKLPLKR